MTDLTGIRTSTGLPLQPSLQHNEEAMHELHLALLRHESLLDTATQAALQVSTAEAHLEELQGRLNAMQRRFAAAGETDAALGTDRIGGLASEAEQLAQDVSRARSALRDAQQRADRANADRLTALNAYQALKTKIYRPSPDPVEVD